MRKVYTFAGLLALGGCNPGSERDPSQAAPRPRSRVEVAPVAESSVVDDAASDRVADTDTLAADESEGDEPTEPQMPADYGAIKPTIPPPDPSSLTLHAVAGYEVVAVYDRPDSESTRLGYLRIGQRLRVTPKIEGPGCPKGWHQVPQGGYACASKGLVVDDAREPYVYRPPPPPRLDQAFPYDYAYVKRWNSPMFSRVPTATEWAVAEERRAILEAERLATAAPADTPAGGDAGASAPSEATHEALPSVDDPVEPAVAPKPATEPAVAVEPPVEVEPVRVPLSPDNGWMEKGFFISIGQRLEDNGHNWWRTARGGYVGAADAYAYTPKDFAGSVLGEAVDFPFGFVMSKGGTKVFELDDAGKLKPTGELERRTFVDLSEETEVAGKTYMMTEDGRLLLKKHLRLAEPQSRPEDLEVYDRWIDVSLALQILVAYQGDRPVYVTLVSSGRKGTKDEPFETPTGRWRIRSKHVSSTMDGPTLSDGNYSIQDVPWTMFFDQNYALHGAFWHNGFGRVRSHGCVNLGATDARWLFNWTTPYLPEGWHGVHAHEGSPGTTVIVRP